MPIHQTLRDLLKSYVDTKARAQARAATKADKLRVDAAISGERKKSEDAAKTIQKQHEKDTVSPIYGFDKEKVGDAVKEIKHLSCFGPTPFDEPWLVDQCPRVSEWSRNPKVQVALGNWGSRYKKRTVFLNDKNVSCRCTRQRAKKKRQRFSQPRWRTRVPNTS